MMDFLEELIAKLFGHRQKEPVRVRAEKPRPQDKQLQGRK